MTGRLDEALARIAPADRAARAAAARELDAKTKPRGSLGRLEELAERVAGIRHEASPGRLRAAIVVAAADHGVAAEGVSAYPQEVTRQMLANFESGGAAVCVLARSAGASLRVVDAGVGTPTANIVAGPAMTRVDALQHIEGGIAIADELEEEGAGIVALGEMGIGNTTAAAAVCAALLGVEPAAACGRGTGLDDAGLGRKVAVVARALRANPVEAEDPVGVLAALGGFELAVLCGVALGAAANRQVVLLDGFIVSVAALVAARLAPSARDAMVAAHLTPEPGHRLVLAALGLEPLLDLGLRLGEGSGAALALPLLDAAVAILAEMATFESAGVTDAGR
ncbi:MAG TPA: nicotinate-nucleotide--dimethylbenzimidazole phosphoribosyltransferase [Gaiellaceae bacterium]|nr:nicotinate-nucleotide--dimethylbenzimidazole phosphoribosyltransferase [Gaiellaceae bacterium]